MQMLSVEEICEVLRVKKWKLRVWRKEGVGPAYVKLPNRQYLYPLEPFQKWLRVHTYQHEGEEYLHHLEQKGQEKYSKSLENQGRGL